MFLVIFKFALMFYTEGEQRTKRNGCGSLEGEVFLLSLGFLDERTYNP